MSAPMGEKERIALRQRYVFERKAHDSMGLDAITDAWNIKCDEDGRPEDKRGRTTIANDLKAGLKMLHDDTKVDASHYRDMLAARIEYAISRPKFVKQIEDSNLLAVDRLLKAANQLAALFGANMPTKIANTDSQGNDIVALTEEERAERVRQMFERARQRQAEEGEMQTGDE